MEGGPSAKALRIAIAREQVVATRRLAPSQRVQLEEGTDLMTDPRYDQHGIPVDLPPAIFRHWVHSREEDADGLEVFRSEGFEFPPSFGRDGFEMHEDGAFVQEDVGPADGIVRVPGRWAAVGPRQVAVSFYGAATREGFSF
jgi:hypothetical protein